MKIKSVTKCVPVALCAMASLLAFSGRADSVFTNKWIAAGGGSWTDSANWQDAEMLGTNSATRAFFDLSGLPSGETVTVPQVFHSEGTGIQMYGLLAGNETSTASDYWRIVNSGDYGDNVRAFTVYAYPDPGDVAVIDVRGGTLRTDASMVGDVTVAKTGSGILKIWATVNWVDFRMVEGYVELTQENSLSSRAVNLYEPGAGLKFDESLKNFTVRRIDSSTGRGTPVDLQGRHMRLNGSKADEVINANVIAGDGKVSANSSCQVRVLVPQPNFIGTYRIAMGDIVFDAADTYVKYKFENAQNPGADSMLNANLVPVGSPEVIQDPTRGSVLSLDGSSYLASPNPAKLPAGLCTGTGGYTVAFWLRIAPECPQTATLFYVGKWEEGGACNLIRLNKENGKSQRGVMYTNYGSNREVTSDATESLYDGNWHHLALTRSDNIRKLYIDGELIDQSSDNVNVKDGEFWIGYGKNNIAFKGEIDDFVYGEVIDVEQIKMVMNASASDSDVVAPQPANSIEAHLGGTMMFSSDVTVAKLTGEGLTSKVVLSGDLTVQGSGEKDECSTFASTVTGEGDLIKKGADYTLTLSGVNDYSGKTRVEEGKLNVIGEVRINGLVGRWKFDDAANPGKDSSACMFDLSNSGVTVVDDPVRGKVGSFDGNAKLTSSDYPTMFPFDANNYTVSLWLKGAPDGNETAGVIVWGKIWTSDSAALWRLDGTSGWMMTNWDQNHNGNGQSFRDNQWHHVVWVRNGSQNVVYIDGVKAHEWQRGGTKVVLDGTSFNLGCNPASGNCFKGLMDDVRVYNVALSAEEAVAEYEGAVAVNTYSETAVLPQPVYRWTFENEAVPGENSGSAEDGNLNVVGNARCAEGTGRDGKVLDLTGSVMSYLEAETFPAKCPTGSASWTAMFWQRTVAANTGNDAMMYWGDPSKSFALFGFYDGNGIFRATLKSFADVKPPEYTTFKPRGARDNWHHVAVSCKDGYVRVYIDGMPVAEKAVDGVDIGNTYFWIGRKQSSETDWFRGYLDDVRIYDSVLSLDTIRKIVRSDKPARVLPEGTDLVVSEGAETEFTSVNQKVRSLSGTGTVRVKGGATLAVDEACSFDGVIDIESFDSLYLSAGTQMKVGELMLGGVRKRSGSYVCGEGRLQVGPLGMTIIIR